MNRFLRPVVVALVMLVAIALYISAAPPRSGFAPDESQWPQWRGSNRDGLSTETGLLKAWPEGGPRLLWTAKGCGKGYVAPAISQGVIYAAGDIGSECFVLALDLNGGLKWKRPNGNAWTGDYPGARGTPTVSGGMVYHLNAHGALACLDARSGNTLWSRNVLKEFGANNITWGLAESVLVQGDHVICRPGSTDACLVALDRRTGRTVWTSKGLSDPASHSSSIGFTFAGIRHIVSLTQHGVVAVNAEDGELFWRYKLPWSNQVIPTPIQHAGHVFITTGDFGGCLKLAREGDRIVAVELRENTEFKSYMSGAVLVDGHLYGFHGVHTGHWCCVDFHTGKTTWAAKGIPKGGLTYADRMLYCVDERGTVSLVKATPETFALVSQFQIPKGGSGPTWAPPVVCGGRLYIRHADFLYAFDIRAQDREGDTP
jgi:outer membrane protein assembly factor BamB